MYKMWRLIRNGKLSCVKNKPEVSSMHTSTNGFLFPGTENTGRGRDFRQKMKVSKSSNLLSFECLRNS